MASWRIAVFILAVAVAPRLVSADVYSYTDAEGVDHFSNVPLDSRYKLLIATPSEAAVSLPKDKSYWKGTHAYENNARANTPVSAVHNHEPSLQVQSPSPEVMAHIMTPEESWQDCMRSLASMNSAKSVNERLPSTELEEVCRNALRLPWYSRTSYEQPINLLYRYLSVVVLGSGSLIVAASAWLFRRRLRNAALGIAKGADRSLFALTGFRVTLWWSGVVQRWRTS